MSRTTRPWSFTHGDWIGPSTAAVFLAVLRLPAPRELPVVAEAAGLSKVRTWDHLQELRHRGLVDWEVGDNGFAKKGTLHAVAGAVKWS